MILAVSAPVVLASNPDAWDKGAEIGADHHTALPLTSVSAVEGFDSFKSSSLTATHFTRVNRALWEKSFDRGSDADIVALAAPPLAASVSNVAVAHRKIGYGTGTWPVVSNLLYSADVQEGLYRKPGIGACLLAAMALASLAVSRRQTGHHPIVPPRLLHDAHATANGAR